MPSQDSNPCPIVRPNYKLNCVWCTVELKVIENLECRIKFYREKKPRHFFYTIEYPYPPTNSAHSCVCERFIYSQDRPTYFLQQKRQTHHLGIYNSLTDTWMCKLRLRPRYSFSGKICFIFSVFCLCSARGVSCKENVRGRIGQGHIVTVWVQSRCLFLWWWRWTSWLWWSHLAPACFNRNKVLVLHLTMVLFKEYTSSHRRTIINLQASNKYWIVDRQRRHA